MQNITLALSITMTWYVKILQYLVKLILNYKILKNLNYKK
jgi:hypothetical protein